MWETFVAEFYSVCRSIRRFVIFVILAAGTFYFYPLIGGGADNPCEALATRGAASAVADDSPSGGQALVHLLGGPLVKAAVAQNYPGTPPWLACTAIYWRTLFDPDAMRTIGRTREQRTTPTELLQSTPQDNAAALLLSIPQGYATGKPIARP